MELKRFKGKNSYGCPPQHGNFFDTAIIFNAMASCLESLRFEYDVYVYQFIFSWVTIKKVKQ